MARKRQRIVALVFALLGCGIAWFCYARLQPALAVHSWLSWNKPAIAGRVSVPPLGEGEAISLGFVEYIGEAGDARWNEAGGTLLVFVELPLGARLSVHDPFRPGPLRAVALDERARIPLGEWRSWLEEDDPSVAGLCVMSPSRFEELKKRGLMRMNVHDGVGPDECLGVVLGEGADVVFTMTSERPIRAGENVGDRSVRFRLWSSDDSAGLTGSLTIPHAHPGWEADEWAAYAAGVLGSLRFVEGAVWEDRDGALVLVEASGVKRVGEE